MDPYVYISLQRWTNPNCQVASMLTEPWSFFCFYLLQLDVGILTSKFTPKMVFHLWMYIWALNCLQTSCILRLQWWELPVIVCFYPFRKALTKARLSGTSQVYFYCLLWRIHEGTMALPFSFVLILYWWQQLGRTKIFSKGHLLPYAEKYKKPAAVNLKADRPDGELVWVPHRAPPSANRVLPH